METANPRLDAIKPPEESLLLGGIAADVPDARICGLDPDKWELVTFSTANRTAHLLNKQTKRTEIHKLLDDVDL